jgi:hypothetical protein
MTPKEKALELIEKFKLKIDDHYQSLRDDQAKQCALILCDEMLVHYPIAVDDEQSKNFHEYWKNVKSEIEKL